MRPRPRRPGGVLVLVLVLVGFVLLSMVAAPALSGVSIISGDVSQSDPPEQTSTRTAETVRLVHVGDENDRLWPYTSRARAFDTMTLPINLVVEGNPARVRTLLVYSHDAKWDQTNESWQMAPEEVSAANTEKTPWGSATGANRYTYVQTDSGGIWIRESMQLHDGTYFGSRIHLRLYGGGTPSDSWTAIQAHRDYWDWFRLRHTVTSLAGPQHAVERDLMRQPTVVETRRERFANGGIIDADGWVSVFELAPRQLVSGASPESGSVGTDSAQVDASGSNPTDTPTPRSGAEKQTTTVLISLLAVVAAGLGALATGAVDREDIGAFVERLRWSRLADRRLHRGVLLFASLAAIPLLVRSAGLVLEGYAPQHPKPIAALLYPFFAFAPTIVAVRLPRGLSWEHWFSTAFVGYGIGLVADLGLIGVSVIPVEIVLHRFAVLVSLGLLAVVGQHRSRSKTAPRAPLLVALGVWISLLAWPLLFGI
ncbi:hypothetical protein ACH9L7_18245 (plasmid) [Haloferax sp. S1W]|uniref:hypothetical protein n=1 Tax=Haloferax sp. S1W TaxID=3377110 RepID=UPI0037CBFD0A